MPKWEQNMQSVLDRKVSHDNIQKATIEQKIRTSLHSALARVSIES